MVSFMDRDSVAKYLPGFDNVTEDIEVLPVHILAAKFIQAAEGYTVSDIKCAFNAIAMVVINENSTFRFCI